MSIGLKVATVALLSFAIIFPGATALAKTPTEDGMLIYGQTGNFAAKWRAYDNGENKFSPPSFTKPGSAVPLNFIVRTSPKNTEAVAGYSNANGVLQVDCFDGKAWLSEWSATIGDRGSTRKFDIAYETNSGNVMVAYAAESAEGGFLYRVKSGGSSCGETNWSAPVTFHPKESAKVGWIKIAADPRSSSNALTAIWADNKSQLSAVVWSGSTWGNEPATPFENSLQVIKSDQDVDDFAVAYESLSGNVKVVWGSSSGQNGKSGMREANCIGGTAQCVWSAVAIPSGFSDDATNLELAPNPQSNEMIFTSIGKDGSDLQAGYWSGKEWMNTENFDITAGTPELGTHLVTAGWMGSDSVIAYGNGGSTGLSWAIGNKGKFEMQKNMPSLVGVKFPIKQIAFTSDPSASRAMLLFTDSNDYLFANELNLSSNTYSWSNTGDTLGVPLGKNVPFPVANSFAFAFWPGAQSGLFSILLTALRSPFLWIVIIILFAGSFWLRMKRRQYIVSHSKAKI